MKNFFAALAALILLSATGAIACPTLPARNVVPLLPLATGMYYCATPGGPETIGDLSPDQWLKHVQVCSTNCDYEPMMPGDPHTVLVATTCGAGYHQPLYIVEPPPAKPVATLRIVDPACKALPPSKAPPPPSPAPAASGPIHSG